MMADDTLSKKVTLEARPISSVDLPVNFSHPLTDWLLNQNNDIQKVADQSNSAAGGAFNAQEVNDAQNKLIASQQSSIKNSEILIAKISDDVKKQTKTIADNSKRISNNEIDIDALIYRVTRKKSEVVWTGQSLVIPTTGVNLVSILKNLTPISGELAPFFNTTTNKMNVFNENKTLAFKLTMIGSWAGGSVNRSVSITFSGGVPDTINDIRYPGSTPDEIFFATFFSVDVDGFLATNGSVITIQSEGSAFTANTIKLIAEQ